MNSVIENKNRKFRTVIRILPDLPLELQNRIWDDVIFSNLNLDEILEFIGIHEHLDLIISQHFGTNIFIISRFMNENTQLIITNVNGKILIKSDAFNKLLNLLLSKKIEIQKLTFVREIFEIFTINKDISKLVYFTKELCNVYYNQLIEFQNWETLFLKKVKFLSISSTDDISVIRKKYLRNLEHVVLNIYDYPINLKYIAKFLSFIIKLKNLSKLDIKIAIDKNLELPDCLFEALKLISLTDLEIRIQILDNNLTFKNMKFDWLNEKISPVCQYVTDLSMNVTSESFIDFTPLNNYHKLRKLKISAYYSSTKSGYFKIDNNPNLKSLELYYFDRQMRYSLHQLNGLQSLVLNSCDISPDLLKCLPQNLKTLTLSNCFYKSLTTHNRFTLPTTLSFFKYEMQSLSQEFPDFANLKKLTSLRDITLAISTKVPQVFIENLPNNVRNLNISCLNSETQIDWESMDFSILKHIHGFQMIGKSMEYDLKLLPPNLRELDFRLQVSVFKNKLPIYLEKLNISFMDMHIPICATINSITMGLKYLEILNITGNRLNYDLSRLEYNNLKKIKVSIGHGMFKSKAMVKVGNLPNTLVRFQIASKSNETVLYTPKALVKSNRLAALGILENITDIKESEVSKINLEAGMSRLKIDNVGNKMKNENQKTKSKIKNLLRRS